MTRHPARTARLHPGPADRRLRLPLAGRSTTLSPRPRPWPADPIIAARPRAADQEAG